MTAHLPYLVQLPPPPPPFPQNTTLSEQFPNPLKQNGRKRQNRYPYSTQIYDRSLSLLGTGTSIKRLGNKQVLWTQTTSRRAIMLLWNG